MRLRPVERAKPLLYCHQQRSSARQSHQAVSQSTCADGERLTPWGYLSKPARSRSDCAILEKAHFLVCHVRSLLHFCTGSMYQFLPTLSTSWECQALIAIRCRGGLGCTLFFQIGSSDKPLPLKPLSMGLTRSCILRVRIERMSIILDLFAIRICHNM